MGRTLHFTMSDKRSVEKFVKKVLSGLMLIDKSSHKGIHNMWILQSMLIPLPIYKISISVVTFWEHKVSSYLRKCLKIHHSATNISLYSWTSFYHLPLKSLTSILNSTKVSRHLLLRESTAEKFVSLLLSWNVDFGMSQRQILMLKVDLNFQKLLDTIKHPELALDHSKAHLFLAGTLMSIEDLFRTWSVKLIKMHIMLNLCSSICRATGLNGVILWKMTSLGKHCWQCLSLWSPSV